MATHTEGIERRSRKKRSEVDKENSIKGRNLERDMQNYEGENVR